MMRPDFRKDLFRWDSARWISLHGVIGRRDFLAQPAFDRRITLLQGTNAGAHDLASRCVSAGRHLVIDEPCMLGRQAERALRH